MVEIVLLCREKKWNLNAVSFKFTVVEHGELLQVAFNLLQVFLNRTAQIDGTGLAWWQPILFIQYVWDGWIKLFKYIWLISAD